MAEVQGRRRGACAGRGAGGGGTASAAGPAPSSSSDPVARQLDVLEATIATLEGEAAAVGLFTPSPTADDDGEQQRSAAQRTTTRGMFSRHRRQEPAAAPPPPSSPSSNNPAALYKEALRISEYSTQQLLKLDAVELPHAGEEGGGGVGGTGGGGGGGSNGNNGTATALARERVSALRSRRKALIKRAQALGDAMDRAKERLK